MGSEMTKQQIVAASVGTYYVSSTRESYTLIVTNLFIVYN